MNKPVTALIDYGSGNLASAAKALARAAGDKADIVTTADPQVVADAERIVLPGVGAFADCMAGLKAVPGMVEALREKVLKEGAPFLGICVGMQLLATVGVEFGRHAGLGWIAGEVVKITPNDFPSNEPPLKIPHMGWNEIKRAKPPAAGRHLDRPCLFRAFLSVGARAAGRPDRHHRLWRAADRHGGQREYRRHPIPSGKEPGHRHQAAGKLFAWRP